MKTIGLTGNLGSGKSTVAKVFESFGYVILDADAMAKELYFVAEIRIKVEELLGETISNEDGSTKYNLIAEHYFNKPGVYLALNSILYPALQEKIEAAMESLKDKPVLVEAAMLFEIGLKDSFEYTITVSTPIEERIHRVYNRNGSSREQFMEREKLQSPAEWKEKHADYVIRNDERSSVVAQVNRIVQAIG